MYILSPGHFPATGTSSEQLQCAHPFTGKICQPALMASIQSLSGGWGGPHWGRYRHGPNSGLLSLALPPPGEAKPTAGMWEPHPTSASIFTWPPPCAPVSKCPLSIRTLVLLDWGPLLFDVILTTTPAVTLVPNQGPS